MSLKLISSNGGAYLVMAAEHLSKWPGASDMKVYDSIPFGADQGLIAEVNGIPVIVLGVPDGLHAVKQKDGALFVTVISCDNDKDIPKALKKLPEEGWTSRGLFTVTDDLAVFDSATPGDDVSDDDSFTLKIPAGEYEALALTLTSDSYELQLLQLKLKSPHAGKQKKINAKTEKSIPEKTKFMTYKRTVSLFQNNEGWQEFALDEGNRFSYLNAHKKLIATVELIGDEVVVQFIKPCKIDDLKDQLHFYSELKSPPGWLEFRRRADDKPGPSLEAGLGSFLGIVQRENTLPSVWLRRVLCGATWNSASKTIGSMTMFYAGEQLIATLEQNGKELIVQIKQPTETAELTQYLPRYTKLAEPKDWLELRCTDQLLNTALSEAGIGRFVAKLRKI